MRWKRHQCGGEQSFGQPVVAICINAGEKKFLPSTLIDILGLRPRVAEEVPVIVRVVVADARRRRAVGATPHRSDHCTAEDEPHGCPSLARRIDGVGGCPMAGAGCWQPETSTAPSLAFFTKTRAGVKPSTSIN